MAPDPTTLTDPSASPADPPTQRQRPRVCLASITASHYHHTYVESLARVIELGTVDYWLSQVGGPYLDQNRNNAIAKMIAVEETEFGGERFDWLLFVDSDIAFNPDDIARLIAPVANTADSTPVISGVYANPNSDRGGFLPVVYGWGKRNIGTDEDPAWRETFEQLTFDELAQVEPYHIPFASSHLSPDICAVTGVGAGFLAIARHLIDDMLEHYSYPDPWFWEGTLFDILLGEDLGFSARVRAMDLPVLVHRGVRLAHTKPVRINP